MFDPYEILGVARDASVAAVKRAYRKRVKKVHPDAGGTAEKFALTHKALVVLTDPRKREQFDRDGTIDERPDNAASDAAGVVLGLIGGLLQSRLDGIFQIDLIVVLRKTIDEIIAAQQQQITAIEANIARARKVSSRIKAKDGKQSLLHEMIEHQVEEMKKMLANPRRIIAQHKDALALLDQLEYERDPVKNVTTHVGPAGAYLSLNDLIQGIKPGG